MPFLALLLTLFQTPAPAPTQAAAPTPSPLPSAAPSEKPLPNGPVVVLETSLGPIRIGLHKDKAPISVDNFIRYVRAGHYDGTIFHRVIPGFMAQGGGFEPSMTERTQTLRPPIRNEASNGLRNARGAVSMARTNDPNSATAQFYINVKDNHALDFGIRGAGYAVFGEVLDGMDVVDKIVSVQTTTKGYLENVPMTPIVIKTAREEGAAKVAPAASRPVAPASARPAAPKPGAPAAVPSAKPASPSPKAAAPAPAKPAATPTPKPSPNGE